MSTPSPPEIKINWVGEITFFFWGGGRGKNPHVEFEMFKIYLFSEILRKASNKKIFSLLGGGEG